MELLKKSGTDIKIPEFMDIQIYEGRVVISDYSKNDDRNLVLALMGATGINPEVHNESWCG